jgi:hypothetical protein
MPPKPSMPAPKVPAELFAKDGFDLMGGRQMKTTPACPPKMLPKVPQLGLNMGMDRRP